MKALSSTGIAISLLSGFLFLALVAQLYYLLCWKKKRTTTTTKRQLLEEEDDIVSSGKELLYLICWKKPSCSLRSTVSQEICSRNNPDGEEGIEAELMRLHNLSGPPRFLFTIKEETREDLESEDGSRKNSKGKSFSDNESTTPYLTPLSSPPFFTPPMTPLDYGFKPLFESFKSSDSEMIKMKSFSSSPPPKFKFLRDAEDKLYRKILTEEAMRVHKSCPSTPSPSHSKVGDDGDGSLITIIIGKNREKGQQQSQQYSNSSQ